MSSFARIIEDAIENYLNGINTGIPAKVVKVDNKKGMCDVQPVIKIRYADETVNDPPVITNVPIAFYRAGSAAIYIPVHVGDTVDLRFSQRSLDLWLAKGESPIDPLDYRKFHISDAIAYPGLYPFTNPPEDASDSDVVIVNKSESGNSKIVLKPNGEIEMIGTSAIKALADLVILSGDGDAVALASLVKTELEALQTYITGHTHPYVDTPVGPATTLAPLVPPNPIGEVKSDKVLAEQKHRRQSAFFDTLFIWQT